MKVSIIGAGRVGSAAAFSMLHQLNLDELVLIDIIEDLAEGEALDIKQASYALGNPVVTYGGNDYTHVSGSDVSVIIAGKPRTADMDRMQLIEINTKIVSGIAKNIVEHNPDGIIVVVTNPMDVMTYVAWKASGLPRHRVFGMGGLLDTARLHSIGYEGVVIGEHGRTKVPLVDNPVTIAEEVSKVNDKVIALKKGTVYAPAACVAHQVKAVLDDTKEILPCSCILDGEYGVKDVAIGVPARIGRNGVEQIIEEEMTEQHKKMFDASVEKVRRGVEKALSVM